MADFLQFLLAIYTFQRILNHAWVRIKKRLGTDDVFIFSKEFLGGWI